MVEPATNWLELIHDLMEAIVTVEVVVVREVDVKVAIFNDEKAERRFALNKLEP